RRQRLACIDPVAEDDGVAEEDGARAIAVRMLAEIPNHWPEREEIRILEAERSSPLVARMLRALQQRRHEDVGHHEPEYDEQQPPRVTVHRALIASDRAIIAPSSSRVMR